MTKPVESTGAGPHPDIERTIVNYRRDFSRRFRANPLRQTARLLLRRRSERQAQAKAETTAREEVRTVAIPPFLRPPSYSYRGYRGPWLEEYFFSKWREPAPIGATYLPVFFDSLFFHAQSGAFTPTEFRRRYETLWRILRAVGESPRPHFTLLGMYEFPIWEWHLFPRNIIVAAAAGYGDLPIPLLKGDRPLQRRSRDIRVSFMGALGGPSNVLNVRADMYRAFAGRAHFGEGKNWEQIMARSQFSLCPRGQGPTSFRLAEALSFTSIPIYIWKARCWLPYPDELDWSEFAFVIEASELPAVRERVRECPEATIGRMHDRIADVYSAYFRYDAVCSRLRKKMDAISDCHEAERITAARADFEFGH